MGDITRNFSRWEFACKCKCGFDAININLVHRLQVVRDILNVEIEITSGCRCWDHHVEIYKKLGKIPPRNSCHLDGTGVDWTVEGEEKFMEAGRLLANWSGGFHQYSDFIHCDIGRKRRWDS